MPPGFLDGGGAGREVAQVPAVRRQERAIAPVHFVIPVQQRFVIDVVGRHMFTLDGPVTRIAAS